MQLYPMWQVCNKKYTSAGLIVKPKAVGCIHFKVMGCLKAVHIDIKSSFGKCFVIFKLKAGRVCF